MTTTDIVPVTYDQSLELAQKLGTSALLPEAYRGKPADMAIAILYGSEIGLPAMTALQRINVVKGRPTLDAQGMVGLFRNAGHNVSGETSSTSATIRGKRKDSGDEMTVTFTIEDAKRAGLLSNAVYAKFPDDLLWARCVSRLGRRLFSDLLMGFAYGPEEAAEIDALPDTARGVPSVADAAAAAAEDDEVADGVVMANPANVEAIRRLLETIGDPTERREARVRFRDTFGPPADLTADQEVEALAWARETVASFSAAPDPAPAAPATAEDTGADDDGEGDGGIRNRRLFALLGKLDIKDQARRDYASSVLDRVVESFTTLTSVEREQIIAALEEDEKAMEVKE